MPDDLKSVIQRIKDEADIVAVVGRSVALKKAGSSYKGLCPFHNEKTPSFNVVPSKGIFHCFGCKAGGSVIDFLMRAEHLEFMEAVKRLADELGIKLPAAGGPEGQRRRDESEEKRRALLSLNEFAMGWFRANLTSNRVPEALAYMQKRDIPEDLAEKFALGASPDDWSAFLKAAQGRGYSDQLCVEAGLCRRHEERGTVYDFLRHRLIFPIRDHLGRVVAFGGRQLSEDKTGVKYMNSPETEVYHKGRTLYALDLAGKVISEKGYTLITEGYMDALMAHRFGFENTIASLGTALTEEQARLIKRYASRAVFMYDGDAAGRSSMLKGGAALLAAGLDVRVVLLPEEDDPDTFLKREGTDALAERIKHAKEYFDFALAEYAAREDLSTIAGKGELVENMAPLLNAMTNDVQRDAGISRLISRLGDMPREAIYHALERKRREARPRRYEEPGAGPAQRTEGDRPAPQELPLGRFDRLERSALKLMLENRRALDIMRSELDEAWLTDNKLMPWIAYFLNHDGDASALIAEAEAEGDWPGDSAILPELAATEEPLGDPEHAAKQIVARMKQRHHRRVTRELLEALREAWQNNPDDVPEGLLKLMHEESRLLAKIRLPNAPL